MIEITAAQLGYANMILKSIMDLTMMLNEVKELSDEECDKKLVDFRSAGQAERDRLDSH